MLKLNSKLLIDSPKIDLGAFVAIAPAQIVTQWVPSSRASNSECPTTVRAEIGSRHNQVMTTGGTKMSTGHIGDGNAAVLRVLSSFVVEAVKKKLRCVTDNDDCVDEG